MNFSFCLIARNEEHTLPRLLKSLDEFKTQGGKVYVLDTGSTDSTVNVARDWGCIVEEVGDRFVIQIDKPMASKINKAYCAKGEEPILKEGDKQFDYSSARNYIATFSETDFIFTPDCDEIFTAFNIDVISGLIEEGIQQLEYNFVFSHNEDGSPAIQFMHCKAYNREKLEWTGIIHEVLRGNAVRQYVLEDIIKLEHYQNPATNRSHYLRGLALDVHKNPSNDRNSHYFGRELFYTGRYESAIKELKRHISIGTWQAERAQSMIFIGDCYGRLNLPESQVEWYNKAIYTDSTRREVFIRLADFYSHNKNWQASICYAKAALEIPYSGFYANDMSHYEDIPHKLLYIGYGWMGNIQQARFHNRKCLEYKPTSYEYLRDYKYYNNQLPKIVVLLPHIAGTREEGLKLALESIASQNYPQELIEVKILEGDDTVPQKVKRGVEECDKQNDYVVFAADDVQFSPNDFIQAYLQLNKGDGYFLCAFNTGIKECEHFMFILEGLDFLSNGEIFDTRFHHVGCDNWLWEQMDELSFATRAHLTNTKHNHFSRGGQMDAVYEKGWDKTQQDRDLLQALKETFKP
jgi:glycosyltransferase involved in cell wall biosynthesis